MDGGIEGTGNSAEGIVGRGVSAIETDRNAAHTRIDNHARDIFRDQRAVRGKGNAQSFVGSVTRELENVGTVEGLSATKYQNWIGSRCDLVDDAERRLCRKIGGRAQFSRCGAAVNASQIAPFSDFPENQACLVL